MGAIQTSFSCVCFRFVVDLLQPHETATAQRKRGILSKSFRGKKKSLDGLEGRTKVTQADLLMHE